MTDTKIIRELAAILRENRLTKIDITENGSRILLERALDCPTAASLQTSVHPSEEIAVSEASELPSAEVGTAVKAPLVGTVYLAPKPGEAPFVSAGSPVKAGDVLCTVEAMKMFNEIKAPHDGVVTVVCVKNGQGVGYGEKLFVLSKEA